jgi:hypothetical protein
MGASFRRSSSRTKNLVFPYRTLPSSQTAIRHAARCAVPAPGASASARIGKRVVPRNRTDEIDRGSAEHGLIATATRRAARRKGNSSGAPAAPARTCGLKSLRHARQRQICHDANGYVTTRSNRRSAGS